METPSEKSSDIVNPTSQTALDVAAATSDKSSGVDAAKSGSSKLWLLIFPVAGLCFLSLGVVAGGLVFLQTRSGSEDVKLAAENPPEVGEIEVAENETVIDDVAETEPEPTAPAVSPPAPQSESGIEANPMPAAPVDLPAVCQNLELTTSPPTTDPVFSPVNFATRYSSDGWPLDAALRFTTAITQIQASFGFAGMRNGLAWERAWYFWDQELVRGSGNWDAGPRGQLTISTQVADQEFVPGRYRLEILVEDEVVAQGSFVLVAPETSVTRSVQVAYTTWNDDDQTYGIDLLNLESRETEPLLASARHPAWSPDGVGLLFVGQDGFEAGEPGLWVFNSEQQQSYPLSEETFFRSVAWSPQRTYVASAADDGQGPQLVLWNLFQNEATYGPPGEDPAWSPEGRRLAYRGCTQTNWAISVAKVISNVIDLDSIQHLTTGDDSQPSWSPDGQRLAFVRQETNDENTNLSIYTVAVDGSNLTRLTDEVGVDVAPVWVSENEILFYSLQGGKWGLYLMNADGSGQRQLLETLAPLDWQPDPPAISPDFVLTEPTPPPPPKPKVQVPAGMGILVVSNTRNNDEMTFTIDNKEHKIGPYRYATLPLNPGNYTWTASWPAKVSRTGVANIILGQVSYPVLER